MADENKQYQLTGETFTDEPYGIAVKRPIRPCQKINASLKMKADGRYEKSIKMDKRRTGKIGRTAG